MTRQLEFDNPAQPLDQPPIWIDTLCVPVHPDLKEDRRAAIVGLARTFKNATLVLVLDADLQNTTKSCSRLERGTRLLCAGWMRRLWTYQEAVIAEERTDCQKLQIQFSGGALPFHSLAQKQGFLSICHTQKAINSLYGRLPLVGDSSTMFTTLIRALQYRSTSRLEDESICLASILGRDLKELSQTKCPNRRMAIFYSFIDSVLADIIFLKMDNLDIDGYRWAPRSFLMQGRTLSKLGLYQDQRATRDANGLYVTFSGFRLSKVDLPPTLGDHFYLRESRDAPAVRQLTCPVPSFTRNITAKEVWAKNEKRNEFDSFVHKTLRLAVIQNPESCAFSVLVAILREEGGTIYCRYLRLVHSDPVSSVPRDRGSIAVERLSGEQRWCVA